MILKPLITPTGAIIIGILVAVFIIAFIFSRKARNKLLDEGKIIMREPRFWDKSETFSIAQVTLEAIYNRLPKDDLHKYMGVYELQKEHQRIVFVHNGYDESFTGTLNLISSENGINTYELLINQYKTKSSTPNELSLNVLFTAVEKIFLSYDPNVKVTTRPVSRKTRTSLF